MSTMAVLIAEMFILFKYSFTKISAGFNLNENDHLHRNYM